MKLSIAEKTMKAREGLESGKYPSVDAACKALKFSQASYYNYARKLSKVLPENPVTLPDWRQELATLKLENEDLKRNIETYKQKVARLERQLIRLVLGEGHIIT
jgi:ACT domain-containing protein